MKKPFPSSAFRAGAALVAATIAFSNIAVAVFAYPNGKPLEISPLGADFSAGFRAGYKKACPFGLCPLTPLPPLGKDTYADGFGIGYAQGLIDNGE